MRLVQVSIVNGDGLRFRGENDAVHWVQTGGPTKVLPKVALLMGDLQVLYCTFLCQKR